ncbi:sugar transporter [Rudanella paleaurantiibacter]|uniref:Sugar transporter n=1 Tax=Rudanella paleaurantiibacter TaxID=2614655 RepID=A0A7J5TXQ7_9BACT|nr:SLBB domain-containing protein [Rudanella paleaurantiibacter]KAB7729429.1 sugar transporter [Rudanella paleaurantiibacter]
MLVFVCLWGACVSALAQQTPSRVDQLTDEQVAEFYRRAQASGLSEIQIEQAAMSQGYTLDDIAKMRRRIAQIRSQTAKQNGQSVADTGVVRSLPGDLSRPYRNSRNMGRNSNLRDTSLLLLPKLDTLKRPVVFGASLFQNADKENTGSIFEPNLRIATPRGYIVGPDDEIIIDIYGASADNYKLRVSPEGTIKVQNLAPIFVSGLTIEQAEQRIIGRLRQAYQGLNRPGSGTYANISLGQIRSIRVTLVGEVVRPGTYTISSLGSAFNALYLGGGPNPETGSFRRISVIRGNRVVRTIDLYDFLLRADQRDNIRLQDQDVIRVADYEVRVELAGEVRRPAIYEVLPGENLKTVLGFAGNFTDEAYTASISLRRNTARERKILTISQEELATFVPQRGDKYTVGRILERYENRIQITGAVMRPGEYALTPGLTTVRELLQKAEGLRKDAFTNRANIYRERDNMDTENIPFDVGRLLKGEIADIPLLRQDSVVVQSVRDLREEYTIRIEGAVNRPDIYPFVNNLSVADLIALAGGFQEGASASRIEVSRRIRQDTVATGSPNTVKIFTFTVDKDLKISDGATQFVLEPFDIVAVRSAPFYERQQRVFVDGEVMYPGNYAILNRTERVTDLIKLAGGLKSAAYLAGAQFKRKGNLVATDLRKVLENPGSEQNILLEDGDSLFVSQKSEVVSIQGAVLNPVLVNFEQKFSVNDYIQQAGGFTENARRKKTYITYQNGRKDVGRSSRVEPGSTIVVPFKPLEESKLSPTERIGILSLIGTLAATATTLIINLSRAQ